MTRASCVVVVDLPQSRASFCRTAPAVAHHQECKYVPYGGSMRSAYSTRKLLHSRDCEAPKGGSVPGEVGPSARFGQMSPREGACPQLMATCAPCALPWLKVPAILFGHHGTKEVGMLLTKRPCSGLDPCVATQLELCARSAKMSCHLSCATNNKLECATCRTAWFHYIRLTDPDGKTVRLHIYIYIYVYTSLCLSFSLSLSLFMYIYIYIYIYLFVYKIY